MTQVCLLSAGFLFFCILGCTRATEAPRESVSKAKTSELVAVSPSQDPPEVKPPQNKSDICFDAFGRIMTELDESAGFEPFVNVFQNFKHCMDASFAVGVNGHVTSQLLRKWNQLKGLDQLFKKDNEFKKFFLGGISCAASTKEEIQALVEKAQKNCPRGLTRLCLDIATAAKRVLPCEEY